MEHILDRRFVILKRERSLLLPDDRLFDAVHPFEGGKTGFCTFGGGGAGNVLCHKFLHRLDLFLLLFVFLELAFNALLLLYDIGRIVSAVGGEYGALQLPDVVDQTV